MIIKPIDTLTSIPNIVLFIHSSILLLFKSAELVHFNDVHHPKLHPSTQLNKQLCWRFFYICGSQYAEPKRKLQPKTLAFQPKWTNAKNSATELMSTSAFAAIPNKNVEKDTKKRKTLSVWLKCNAILLMSTAQCPHPYIALWWNHSIFSASKMYIHN